MLYFKLGELGPKRKPQLDLDLELGFKAEDILELDRKPVDPCRSEVLIPSRKAKTDPVQL